MAHCCAPAGTSRSRPQELPIKARSHLGKPIASKCQWVAGRGGLHMTCAWRPPLGGHARRAAVLSLPPRSSSRRAACTRCMIHAGLHSVHAASSGAGRRRAVQHAVDSRYRDPIATALTLEVGRVGGGARGRRAPAAENPPPRPHAKPAAMLTARRLKRHLFT
jgi:hypothetical protein